MKKLLTYRNIAIFFVAFTFVAYLVAFYFYSHDTAINSWLFYADNEAFGNFGDFVGGVLGPIFGLLSIIFVLRTIQEQRKLSETQRFNDLFFHLLDLYLSEVNALSTTQSAPKQKVGRDLASYSKLTTSNTNITKTGKDFFVVLRDNLLRDFDWKDDLIECIDAAVGHYQNRYLANIGHLDTYFRTLYRLYELLDTSNISEDEKRRYSKIIRSQLNEGELFFLRYNALTYKGKNFQNYLIKYNVLKHLPLLDLLEMKYWSAKLRTYDRLSLNNLFYDHQKDFRTWFKKDIKQERATIFSLLEDKYFFYAGRPSSRKIRLMVRIDKSNPSVSPMSKILNNFTPVEIHDLIEFFLLLTFDGLNFGRVNGDLHVKKLERKRGSRHSVGVELTSCREISCCES